MILGFFLQSGVLGAAVRNQIVRILMIKMEIFVHMNKKEDSIKKVMLVIKIKLYCCSPMCIMSSLRFYQHLYDELDMIYRCER